MKKKILYTFLLVLVIINGVLLYLIIDKKMSGGPSKGQTFLTEQLKFSEDQKDKFFLLDREHRTKMKQMDEELGKLRKLLFNSFDNQKNFIDSITLRMGDVETDKQIELFSFFKDVREICTKDQVKKFDEIIQEVLRKRGPKHPEGEHDGPPPPPKRKY